MGRDVVHTDHRFATAVERAVADIEARTAAELVVVAAPRSGSYRDIALLGGLAAGVLVLAFLCWSPVVFDALWFPVDVAAVAALVAAVLDRGPAVRLASAARRRRQVREAAEAAFVQEAVHGTSGRTGLLVYVSAAEARVELLPDQGLLGRVPGARWNAMSIQADTLEHLVEGLKDVGAILAEAIPRSDDDVDEIANAPRVRA